MPSEPMPDTAREVFEQTQRLLLQTPFDADALADQYAPDGVFEAPFAPPGVPRRIEGREAIRALYRQAATAAARPRFEFASVVVHETTDPGTIVTEFEVHARDAGSGDEYDFANLQVITVRAGKIVHLRDFWNPLDRPGLRALVEDTP